MEDFGDSEYLSAEKLKAPIKRINPLGNINWMTVDGVSWQPLIVDPLSSAITGFTILNLVCN